MLIDGRERFDDMEELIRLAVEGILKDRHTAHVVQMSKDSDDGHTCVPQPTVKRRVQAADGSISYEDIEPHPDVPIHYPSGGGHSLTHPVQQQTGDTGLVIYAERAIDKWHSDGGMQEPVDHREHSYSDAIYIPGVRSDQNKLSQVSTVSMQKRSDDGKHFYDTNKQNGLTHTSTNMVLSMVGDQTALLQTKQGHQETSPKILMNCAQA